MDETLNILVIDDSADDRMRHGRPLNEDFGSRSNVVRLADQMQRREIVVSARDGRA